MGARGKRELHRSKPCRHDDVATISKCKEIVANFPDANEWISTKDRLPPPHMDVLVTDGKQMDVDMLLSFDITIGTGQQDEEPMWDGDNPYRGPITHWMPLPDYPDMNARHRPLYREEAPE